MRRDLVNNEDYVQSVAPAAYAASVNGAGVDLRDFDGAMMVVDPGAVTDGTHTPKMQESDDDSTYTDVAAADMEKTLAAIAASTVQRVGYKGNKRYVRAVVTVAGATTGGVYGVGFVRGLPHSSPVA